MEALHVVLGSGQIGSLVADLLLARGERVRIVRRGPAGPARDGLAWLSGDLADRDFAKRAGLGASVVYDCTSPAYDKWLTDLMPIARGAMLAARVADAKLVALDNLYMYGRVHGPISEDSPIAPCSKKGELRARLAEERAASGLPIVTARATDFFGPGVVRQTTFGDRFWTRAFAGKSAQCLGDPDAPHALAYAPDVARALVTLGDHDEALGKIWHLPTSEPESMRAMTARIAAELGMTLRVSRVPRLALRAWGMVEPLAREVAEMAYQWDLPYVVDGSRFRAAFGGAPTPIAEVVRETARWARETYGATARAA